MRLSYRNTAIGQIDDLPGSSQVAVFHSSFVLPEHRNTGVGKAAHEYRLEVAKDMLYDYALCTINYNNLAQRKILENAGWVLFTSFFSKKTQHTVAIYGREIK